MKKIYLDYAATTPVDKKVVKAMTPYFSLKYGNPSSLHSLGQEAVGAVDSAREAVSRVIGADFEDVIFTGSATEANNLVFRGTIRQYWRNFFEENGNKDEKILPHIISTSIEHESVLETLKDIESRGAAEVTILPVNRSGLVEIKTLEKELRLETILVSVMYANNEMGSIQPIAEILKVIKKFNHDVLFHTDAVQAFQYLDCNVNELGVDFLTLSSHKIYGPKGIGALFARGKNISPLITGGGQEFNLRSGTENVPLIVGFAKTLELADSLRQSERKRVGELRNYFWTELKKIYPKAEINPEGVALGYNLGQPNYLPNILNVYFPDFRAMELLVKFDTAGVAVSAGSACSARSVKLSHVLRALGLPEERVKSSLRFSLGRFTTDKEIKRALKRIRKVLS